MSTAVLALTEDRPVVQCGHCRLNQYPLRTSLCRRCHRPLVDNPPTPELPPPALVVVAPTLSAPAAKLPGLLRILRERRHLSQTGLAEKLKTARPYVSKVERGKVPRMYFITFERYAWALGTRGSSLMALLQDPTTQLAEPLERIDETLLRHIGPTLRRFREEAGKNPRDIRAITGILTPSLCRLEKGHAIPSLCLLERLARGIGKPVSAIIAEIEESAFPTG